jgi:ParB family chromosome partitioning protein
LGVDQPDIQRRIARRVIEQGLSVRATEQLVRLTEAKNDRAPTKSAVTGPASDPNVRLAESKLQRHFGTKVRIVQTTNSAAGKIELEFYNQTDLNRLFALLTQTVAR